ncbi:TetR/AcrR family transcriptional regulator [Flavilitoribacter nigricans]|uniref:TetR family transcriptional regulator n=1 Tax=Flavilitoribacter nigricans (strain ATCC 23147 / DSM 23189 / NBRC 102662 / NCIMB 1420 / SS-2) TaxID=1122177 RepID=A0A2D0NAL3_FLAN2|nr:TetR/AcrR family transcriptional regulator [Flavilitoribacter nigricans]PHN05544.1 TetR family transcriptional regulator [Flavilitoribacter nigricans DSM 23189 = NBRC 102662]
MKPLLVHLTINPNLYNKNPQKTDLGKRIIEQSVLLIDEIGLEQFTFRKLAEVIGSTEASIYRYFENKHQLFVYLLNWYWEWMIIRIDLNTLNIKSPVERLTVALSVIVDTAQRNTTIHFVDEEVLHRIVVTEGAKGYHHKLVDEENQEGFFLPYKNLCSRIADLITEINPKFPYPRALASTLVETANNNLYFARHLPRLTDLDGQDEQLPKEVKTMLEFFTFGLLHSSRITNMATIKNMVQRSEN